MQEKRGLSFWILIMIAVVFNVFLLIGQTGSLFDYEFVVGLGLQESKAEVTEVGVAWAKGFGFGDTVFYIPIFIIGIIGLLKRKAWGLYFMFGALAVTVYWPLVCLFAVWVGKGDMNLNPDKYLSYSILLPLISMYGLWGMWYLYKNKD